MYFLLFFAPQSPVSGDQVVVRPGNGAIQVVDANTQTTVGADIDDDADSFQMELSAGSWLAAQGRCIKLIQSLKNWLVELIVTATYKLILAT